MSYTTEEKDMVLNVLISGSLLSKEPRQPVEGYTVSQISNRTGISLPQILGILGDCKKELVHRGEGKEREFTHIRRFSPEGRFVLEKGVDKDGWKPGFGSKIARLVFGV